MRLQVVMSIVGQEHLYAFNFDEPLDKWIQRMSENGCYADALMLQLISNKYHVNIRVIHVFHCDGEQTITPNRETGYENSEQEIILIHYSEQRFHSGHYISVKKSQPKELDLSKIGVEHEVSANDLSSLNFNSYAEPNMESEDVEPEKEEPPPKKMRYIPKTHTTAGRPCRTRKWWK